MKTTIFVLVIIVALELLAYGVCGIAYNLNLIGPSLIAVMLTGWAVASIVLPRRP